MKLKEVVSLAGSVGSENFMTLRQLRRPKVRGSARESLRARSHTSREDGDVSLGVTWDGVEDELLVR
jgi:hypothetical protein